MVKPGQACAIRGIVGSCKPEPYSNAVYLEHQGRMAITSKGKGKSGSARVITCVKVVEENVYLLAIYDKSDKESISDKELDQLLVMAGLL